MEYVIIFIVYFFICLATGSFAADIAEIHKMKPWVGFIFGFTLGILGMAIVELIGTEEYRARVWHLKASNAITEEEFERLFRKK